MDFGGEVFGFHGAWRVILRAIWMRDGNLLLPIPEHPHQGEQQGPWVPSHDSIEWVKKDYETTCACAESAARESVW